MIEDMHIIPEIDLFAQYASIMAKYHKFSDPGTNSDMPFYNTMNLLTILVNKEA